MNPSMTLRAIGLVASALAPWRATVCQTATSTAGTLEKGDFRFAYDERGISLLANAHDPFGATLTAGSPPSGRGGRGGAPSLAPTLGLTLGYRAGADAEWTTVATRSPTWNASPERGVVTYTNAPTGAPVKITETYRIDGNALDWTIDLESISAKPVRIGDLSINIPAAGPTGESPQQIFERGFLRQQFVSGSGSFFYYVRASGAPPFLLVTVRPGTKLEYFTGGGRGGGQVFVHSARTGGGETRGTWRQAHTALDLSPAGRPGSRASY
ncbi:MAG TPA: hypothetical protein VK636_07280, partial [Gemmatimonadaceae bacterium]|nr:hypothetical protein [Gemmatimonadaceae bacterium]